MNISLLNPENEFSVSETGFYGRFGGAFVPELLRPQLEELSACYLNFLNDESFMTSFRSLLRDYVGRPTPLYFASRLSEFYGTKIYLKREDLNHTGAHKINNAIGQALLAKRLGKKRIIAETGAGQHGVATATACALLNLPCTVFMGEKDIQRQAPNVMRMKMLGAEVRPVSSGSKTLKDATNEAIREWINYAHETHYIIGSVVGPHPYPDMVAQFQRVISQEIKVQLIKKEGRDFPDAVIACVGGGSNAAGAFYEFIPNEKTRLIVVEAAGMGVDSGASAATFHLGSEGVIHGSRTLLMQNAEGQIIEPHSISAGLDYPGIGPMHAHLLQTKRASSVAVTDTQALEAAFFLTQSEGIIPALESAHAFAALNTLKFLPEELVVICLSGRGDKDLSTYEKSFD
ncbi:MAG: tryptophan synthase subunit beta, partial [Flavobacteriales bacterium]